MNESLVMIRLFETFMVSSGIRETLAYDGVGNKKGGGRGIVILCVIDWRRWGVLIRHVGIHRLVEIFDRTFRYHAMRPVA